GDAANLLLDYRSQEAENKLRYEATMNYGEWRFVGGLNYERARYSTETYTQRIVDQEPMIIEYASALSFNKYGAFGQLSRQFGKLSGSLGLRTDWTALGASTNNP